MSACRFASYAPGEARSTKLNIDVIFVLNPPMNNRCFVEGYFYEKRPLHSKAKCKFIYGSQTTKKSKMGIHLWLKYLVGTTLKTVEGNVPVKCKIEVKVEGNTMVYKNKKITRNSINAVH